MKGYLNSYGIEAGDKKKKSKHFTMTEYFWFGTIAYCH